MRTPSTKEFLCIIVKCAVVGLAILTTLGIPVGNPVNSLVILLFGWVMYEIDQLLTKID